MSLLLAISVFGAIFGASVGLAAIVFGAIGLRVAYRREATNRGQATAGLVLGIISLALAIVIIIGIIQDSY
ncbi:DUF4190 domain-containing protein [Streptomyces sp. HUCO-GS316]|uniref:DUF4190 domain-containing protein n=1 Tax=Streptomyces sp. HUCO-GS316 TaxID=2692198 RepID=UPI00136E2D79|nr:DUF4190 domain-containing protein [Streptomyces sp. HUCO-GS316]MXM69075.1 DUF4190 domain-containing protein [Streptomyces sp. HUCO-GS316]